MASRRLVLIGVLVLGFLAGVLVSRGPGRKWRQAAQIKSEVKWINQAARQLEQLAPPPNEVIQGAVTGNWITPQYLVFSNGWAAYAMHSWHENDGMDDIALLRTSDGVFYSSRCHMCGGIASELLRPNGENPQPADARDLIERRGIRQEWSLYSADGRLRCAVRSPHADYKRASKGVWVWIGSIDGTNARTLFDGRYEIPGAYVSWSTRWISNNAVVVDIFDYGPDRNPYEGAPRRDIRSLRFSRDSQNGQFVESN